MVKNPFGANTRFPDDMAFVAYLLDKEWTLGVDEHPGYVYFDERGLAREQGPGGRGSIYVYDVGFTHGPIQSIDYGSVKEQHNVAINIMNRSKERNQAWTREAIDILDYYRRAGQSNNLNGWDYLEVTSVKKIGGYTDYYSSTIDVRLMKVVRRLPYDGFANISRKEYKKQNVT